MKKTICIAAVITIAFVIAIFAGSGEDTKKGFRDPQIKASLSEVPEGINYQGVLLQNGEPPQSPLVDLTFRIRSQDEQGQWIWVWGEKHTSVPIDQQYGVFSVLLGKGDPNDFADPHGQLAEVFTGSTCSLKVWVNGEELDPALPIGSVPYALRSGDADGGAGDGHSLDAADGNPEDAVYVDEYGNVGIGISPSLIEGADRYLTVSTGVDELGGGDRIVSLELEGSNFNEGETIGKIDFSLRSSEDFARNVARIGVKNSAIGHELCFYTTPKIMIGSWGVKEQMRITGTGNVGIGTSSPDKPLHVHSSLSGSGLKITAKGKSTDIYLHVADDNYGYLSLGGDTKLRGKDYPSTFQGNVGIGTDSPGFVPGAYRYLTISASESYGGRRTGALELQGSSIDVSHPVGKIDFCSQGSSGLHNIARVEARRDGSPDEGELVFSTNNGTTLSERVRIDRDGNVGIGTVAPEGRLHIYQGSMDSSPAIKIVDRSPSSTDLGFHYENGQGTGDVVILNNGKVGIGTTNPSEKLTVHGNILIRSESTGDPVVELGEGLDYAEGFDVSDNDDISLGAVLVIDPDSPGKLTLSDTPYDSKVAGIVAGANGLGSGVRLGVDQFDYDVALAGRVYCNVDATDTEVHPGDLLTTSTTPGYAMKATDYVRAQGAILGKAMENLEKGEKAQIVVLITLQ